jgi:hypothetical protein
MPEPPSEVVVVIDAHQQQPMFQTSWHDRHKASTEEEECSVKPDFCLCTVQVKDGLTDDLPRQQ